MTVARPNATLDGEIAAVGGLSRDDLATRWTKIYGCPPPIGVRRELLSHAVAWNLQAKQLGGLAPETRKALKAAVGMLATRIAVRVVEDEMSQPSNIAQSIGHKENAVRGCDRAAIGGAATSAGKRSTLKAGARIIRQWNGKTNVVDVTGDGFLFDGTTYRSLSAIARKITGAHWSGPRFFGL